MSMRYPVFMARDSARYRQLGITEQKSCRRCLSKGTRAEDRAIVTKKNAKTINPCHLPSRAHFDTRANCPTCKKSTSLLSCVIRVELSFGSTSALNSYSNLVRISNLGLRVFDLSLWS